MRPLVSILIPCFNAERWVSQAIESALAQTWPEKEVIVVDDGSTDNSLEIIKSFGPRIRWETGPNRGANTARNRLLELARGEWLQYLDADDYLLPKKIAQQVEFLSKHPDTDVIYSPVYWERVVGKETQTQITPIPEPHDPWMLLARWYLPQTGGVLWRKQAVLNAGGWKADQPCCQEHELYARLLMSGARFSYFEESYAVWRDWSAGSTLSTTNPPEVRRRRLKIEQDIEDFLREQQQLTTARLSAINQARFEIARIAWLADSGAAMEIVRTIRRSQRGFVPQGPASPGAYQVIYRLLGFGAAERAAALKRAIGWNRAGSAA